MHTFTRFATLVAMAVALTLTSLHVSSAPLLNGVAVHTELGKEQFIAGLYSDSLSTEAGPLLSADENKRIQVRVLADHLSSRRFRRMWIEGIAINSSQADLQSNAQNLADFSNMLRIKLIAGDILTVDRSMEEGVIVSLNGTRLGLIEDRGFFDLLLRTWIGSVPLSSSFRDNLLADGEIEADLLTRFQATRPTDERIAAIEQAVADNNQEKVAQRAEEPKPAIAAIPNEVPADLIEAPTLTKPDPELALVPPSLGVDTPPAATKTPEPKPKPEPEPKPVAKPEPTVTQVAKAKPATTPKPKAPEASDIFEDEDEESFTAASLLSRQLYIGKVKSWAQRELKYPDRALRREWEGNVRLDITLDRGGRLVSVEVAEEAEHSVLTKEALRAVDSAEPFPPMPEDVSGETFLFTLPVAFKLQ